MVFKTKFASRQYQLILRITGEISHNSIFQILTLGASLEYRIQIMLDNHGGTLGTMGKCLPILGSTRMFANTQAMPVTRIVHAAVLKLWGFFLKICRARTLMKQSFGDKFVCNAGIRLDESWTYYPIRLEILGETHSNIPTRNQWNCVSTLGAIFPPTSD